MHAPPLVESATDGFFWTGTSDWGEAGLWACTRACSEACVTHCKAQSESIEGESIVGEGMAHESMLAR